MAEPLGITSSLIAIFDLCLEVSNYIQRAKGAKKEKAQLASEIVSLQTLITGLYDIVDDEVWKVTMADLTKPEGALHSLNEVLSSLAHKLAPASGRKHWLEIMLWPFQANEVKEFVNHIEHEKSTLSLMLNNHIRKELQYNIAKQVKDTAEILQNVEKLIQIDHGRIDAVVRNVEQSRALEVLRWVTGLTFGARQETLLQSLDRGLQTGTWILSHEMFVKWKEHPSSTRIWCHGIPGAGKSVIAALISEHLQETLVSSKPNISLATLYCDHGDQTGQHLDELLRSIFRQVLEGFSTIPTAVLDLHEGMKEKPPSPYELCSAVGSETATRDLYVVLDALDEADEQVQNEIVDRISKLPFANIKLICTSRRLPKFEVLFKRSDSIRISASGEDIEVFATKEIEVMKTHRWKFLNRRSKWEALEREIVSGIREAAGESFLMAKHHMDMLRPAATGKELTAILKKLPTESGKVYEELMKRIRRGYDSERAKTILSLVFGSRRHLRIVEIQHALAAIELEKDGNNLFEDLDEEELTSVDAIIECCQGLLILEGYSIRASHSTANEYFRATYDKWFPNGQSILATACLKYLSQGSLCRQNWRCQGRPPVLGRNYGWGRTSTETGRYFPLLEYSASYWNTHVWEASQRETGFFTMQDYEAMVCWRKDSVILERLGHQVVDKVRFAARVFAKLLGTSGVVNVKTCQDALSTLVLEDSDKDGTTFILDLPGFEMDTNHPKFYDILESGIRRGWYDLTRRLLSPDGPRSGTQSVPLGKLKHFPKIALETCFQDNYRNSHGLFELLMALAKLLEPQNGHSFLLSLFNRRKAMPDSHLLDGPKYRELLMLLFDNQLDLQRKDAEENNLLHVAARNGLQTAVQCLIDHGCDVNALNAAGKSACQVAIDHDHIDVVLRLLPGMSPACKQTLQFPRRPDDVQGLPPKRPIDEALAILIPASGTQSYGKAVDEKGRTALSWLGSDTSAKVGTTVRAVELLLKHGAEINSQDNGGRTAVSYASSISASSSKGESVVKYLIDECADINLHDNFGLAPIHYLAAAPRNSRFSSSTTRLLLKSGASATGRDHAGVSILDHFLNAEGYANSDATKRVETMVKAGADPNAVDNANRRPIFTIIQSRELVDGNQKSREAIFQIFWLFLKTVNLDEEDREALQNAVNDAGIAELQIMMRVFERIKSGDVNQVDAQGKTTRQLVEETQTLDGARQEMLTRLKAAGSTPRADILATIRWQQAHPQGAHG